MDEQQSSTVTTQRAHRVKRRQGVRLTAEQRAAAQDLFLEVFARNAIVAAGCREAGIERNTVYKWLEHDEAFSARYHQAELDATDVIRAAIHQRGLNGWLEPVVSMGKIVRNDDGSPLMVRKYSDALAHALAKARLPEFKDKLDVHVQGGVAHDHQHRIIEDDPEAAAIARALIRRISNGGAS